MKCGATISQGRTGADHRVAHASLPGHSSSAAAGAASHRRPKPDVTCPGPCYEPEGQPLLMGGGEPRAKMLAANRGGGLMTLRECRFPNRLYVSDPGKSYLWFVGVESRLGSRRSVRLPLPKPFHEPERLLLPSLSSIPIEGEGGRRPGEEALRGVIFDLTLPFNNSRKMCRWLT